MYFIWESLWQLKINKTVKELNELESEQFQYEYIGEINKNKIYDFLRHVSWFSL